MCAEHLNGRPGGTLNPSTRHDMTSLPNTDVRPQAAHSIRHPAPPIRRRVHAT